MKVFFIEIQPTFIITISNLDIFVGVREEELIFILIEVLEDFIVMVVSREGISIIDMDQFLMNFTINILMNFIHSKVIDILINKAVIIANYMVII